MHGQQKCHDLKPIFLCFIWFANVTAGHFKLSNNLLLHAHAKVLYQMSITNWMLIRCSGCANNSNCVKFESFQQQITALGTDAKCGRKFNLRSTLHVYFMKQNRNIVWKLQLQTSQDACIKVINTFIISKRLKYITEFLLLFCLFTTIKVIANLKHLD